MLIADSWCHSFIYKGNILISGNRFTHILIYSPEIDSFSIIPYDFKEYKRKILINSERLYLIEDRDWESNGFIYESEIGDEYTWKRVGESLVRYEYDQVYCSYNKESIYIGCLETGNPEKFYYKFNLKEKVMIELKEVQTDAT
ncbi:unnamed protein product [Blepharisma stoltei]|uniref:Uncharacterized protein n=1 Tax=Blepharisma stoltei TaxID=1481888 RepID=A0AAU9JIF8_9CILI|nr:unnamed protein product [Blepharisma stoltei]